MRIPKIIDLRHILDKDEALKLGFEFSGIQGINSYCKLCAEMYNNFLYMEELWKYYGTFFYYFSVLM